MDPKQDTYTTVARVFEDHFQYGLTPAEAIDYIMVVKADVPTGVWADTRGVEHSTVSGNVTSAKEKINESRLDATVEEENEQVTVRVTDLEGEEHDLSFMKKLDVFGCGSNTELQLVYEAQRAIYGYYVSEDGDEFESTLWYEQQPFNSFNEFDFNDHWGSPKAKADVILWQSEKQE